MTSPGLYPQTFWWLLWSTANFVRSLNERVGQGNASDPHDFNNQNDGIGT